MVRQAEEVRGGEIAHLLMPLSPIKAPDEVAVASARSLRLPLDPVLTLAVLGLGICSVVNLRAATAKTIVGDPTYYAKRQAIYLVLGFVFMLVLSRIDYAQLRRLKNGIYAALMLSIF